MAQHREKIDRAQQRGKGRDMAQQCGKKRNVTAARKSRHGPAALKK